MANRTVRHSRRSLWIVSVGVLAVTLFLVVRETAAREPVPIDAFELPNGMTFLLVHREGMPLTAVGWVAHAGSGDETPGRTGVSHLIEHLMFKGSRIIGSRDIDRELEVMSQEDEMRTQIRLLQTRFSEDPSSERRVAELTLELNRLQPVARSLMKKGEYALVYTEAGAVGINALTREDLTLYYLRIPASQIELWFWMESDRLLHPVFREFYQEFDIVDEERRQRIDSAPGEAEKERFTALFWRGHPYSWPVVGRREDLRQLTRADAREFFAAHYEPSNLTAALVGDFDPMEIRALAQKYFGRLPRRDVGEGAGQERDGVRQQEAKDSHSALSRQPARDELRMTVDCACPTQVSVRYRTVPFGHPDSYALDALAGILNGRTGRLHRAFVLDRQIAFSASAQHEAFRRGGLLCVPCGSRGPHNTG